MKKSCATNISQYCWPEIGGKWGTSGACFISKTTKFPRMHSEIVLLGGQMKDQHRQCKLAAIFVHSSNTCITHNAYFVTDMFLRSVYHTDTG